MDGLFERNLSYWLNKQSVPESITKALVPWQNQGFRLLDLGCGGGRLAGAVSGFSEVHAVDRSAKLVLEATNRYPGVEFHVGNFQRPEVWDRLGRFNVIVSNCSIRKDYCNFRRVAALCMEHLDKPGMIVFRIQGREDLESVLPERHRRNLFYDRDEIRSVLGRTFELDVEKYKQRFSTPEYVATFLERIGVQHRQQVLDVTPTRCFYILRLPTVM